MTSPATQRANAIAAITNKSNIPIPEIDFTQHTLENGEIVSTTERVVKDVSLPASRGAAQSSAERAHGLLEGHPPVHIWPSPPRL